MAEYPLDAAPAQAPMRRAGVLALLSAAALGLATAPGLAAGGPIGVLQAMPASLQGVVDTIPLASHRAVYDLSLLKAVGTKSPTGARGRIAFDFSGSTCDGYVQNFRQLTELQPAEGPTRISDMHSAPFEDGNGKSFAFKMETTVDDDPTDQVDGRAERKGRGGVDVNLVKPKTEQLALGRDILFPTEHIKYILAAAEAAENTLEVKVYDGSDSGDKIYDTTTSSAARSIARGGIGAANSRARTHASLAGDDQLFRRWPQGRGAELYAVVRSLRERHFPRPAAQLWRLRARRRDDESQAAADAALR